jgi:pimeloyl-ACP methyl ester carboxylesterase
MISGKSSRQEPTLLTRRQALGVVGGTLASTALVGCGGGLVGNQNLDIRARQTDKKRIAVVIHGLHDNPISFLNINLFLTTLSSVRGQSNYAYYDKIYLHDYSYFQGYNDGTYAPIFENGQRFFDKINALFGNDQLIDIYAHSMGGLVSRVAIEKHGLNINKLITFGTPHLGVPDFVLYWLMYIYCATSVWLGIEGFVRVNLTDLEKQKFMASDSDTAFQLLRFIGYPGIADLSSSSPIIRSLRQFPRNNYFCLTGDDASLSTPQIFTRDIAQLVINTLTLNFKDINIFDIFKDFKDFILNLVLEGLISSLYLINKRLFDFGLLRDTPFFAIENDGIVSVSSGAPAFIPKQKIIHRNHLNIYNDLSTNKSIDDWLYVNSKVGVG